MNFTIPPQFVTPAVCEGTNLTTTQAFILFLLAGFGAITLGGMIANYIINFFKNRFIRNWRIA